MSHSRAELKKDLLGWLWVSPWVIGFLAVLAVPMGMSLYYSFTDYPLLESPVWIGMGNWQRMLTDEVFHAAILKTAWYAILFIPIATAMALVIAALLNEKVKAGGFFQAAVFIPTLVPMAGSAMIWLWMLNGEYGLINQAIHAAFGWAGIEGPNWLQNSRWAMPSILMISLWSIGQMVVVYLAALKEVPDELLEAGALDGMGPVRRFFNITLPMISPVILFNIITLMIGSLQVFAIPYVLSAATPGNDPRAMYFFTSSMYDNAFRYNQMGYASAQAWLQLLITLGLTAIMFAASKRLVHYRA
jgi:multiple sugar transport system permease protein